MVAAMRGYPMTLLMPTNSTQERKDAMIAYGATLIEVDEGIEAARDLALQMQADGKGVVLDQFNNPDNSQAHYLTTGPELWSQTEGKITHFISSMGTTGTITGVSRYLKEQNPDVKIIGLQPDEEASIAGIRRWPAAYMPGIFDADLVDEVMDVNQSIAEVYMRKLAKTEGIFAGVSSGAAAWAATQVAKSNPDAVIAFIVCDRGDRYLSTGLYNVDDSNIDDSVEVN
jgi:cysteine synthase B